MDMNDKKKHTEERRIIMKKQSSKIAFVTIIISCFVMLIMGKIVNAQYYNNNYNWGWQVPQWGNYNYDDDNLTRGGHAYEVQESSGPGYTSYNYRQYTSAYDMMTGNYVPEMTISYSSSNPMAAMFNMFQPYETHSQGSAVGSLYPQTTMQLFPSNPMMSFFAQQYSPKYDTYQSQSIFGNTNYSMFFPGMGMSGFMWGPFGGSTGAGSWGSGPYTNWMY